MTPLCSIFFELLKQEYVFHGFMSVLLGLFSIASFVGGLAIIMYNYKYIVVKELEYGVEY
jgi:hypothetical protein